MYLEINFLTLLNSSAAFKLLSVTERASLRQIRSFLETKIVPLVRNTDKQGGDSMRNAYGNATKIFSYWFYSKDLIFCIFPL